MDYINCTNRYIRAEINCCTYQMFDASFRGFFLFIFSDDHFDLPQYCLVALADRCAQLGKSFRGVKTKYIQKMLMGKVVFRLQTAAGHEGTGHADGGRASELSSDVKRIILCQKTFVNDVEDVLLVFFPIVRRKLGRDAARPAGCVVPSPAWRPGAPALWRTGQRLMQTLLFACCFSSRSTFRVRFL